jgi:tRNA pseudouridine55 synthase
VHNLSTELKEGILLVNKPQGRTSFSLVRALRKLTGIDKIGHAGTLDPFATGVMVMLLGRDYTRLSDKLLLQDKEYLANVWLGVTTDTYDCDGKVVARSKKIPTTGEIEAVMAKFQGEIEQIPPMYSAKKVQGKKLYEWARKGDTIERSSAKVGLTTEILSYVYPNLSLRIACSKGTYIRSIAHEVGQLLGCGAHLSKLNRTRSGSYSLEKCIDGHLLDRSDFDITPHLLTYESPKAL